MHKIRFSIVICLLFIFPIHSGEVQALETYHFRIDFYLIPAVDLTMEIYPTEIINGRPAHKMVYSNHTLDAISKIFEVDNIYETIYDPLTFEVFSSRKTINQSNLQQTISAVYRDGEAVYSNGVSFRVPDNIHNIFSLLMQIRTLDPDRLDDDTRIPIDIEGILYLAKLTRIGEKLMHIGKTKVATQGIAIHLFPMRPDQETVTGKTDIFNWKVGSTGDRRSIWIEKAEPHRIIKTDFYLSPAWLTARLIDDEE